MKMRRTKNPDGTPAKRKLGRPTKYRSYMDEQAYKMTLLGATDIQLCDFFGIPEMTFYAWKKKFPSFCKAIQEGKDMADATVVKRLYERATGYTLPEEKIFLHEGEPVRVETVKHLPPDTTSMIFWLSNRRPDLWKRNPDNHTTFNNQFNQVNQVNQVNQINLNDPKSIIERYKLDDFTDAELDLVRKIQGTGQEVKNLELLELERAHLSNSSPP